MENNTFPHDLNSTNVVLIPKKYNADKMKDLRLIALCNVLYKILSKVLANRIKDVLPGLFQKTNKPLYKGEALLTMS